MTKRERQLLIENHPDRHGGDHAHMEKVFAERAKRSWTKAAVRFCNWAGCGGVVRGVSTHCNIHWRAAKRLALTLPAVLVALGCKTSESKTSHQMPMPPLPRATRSSAGTEANHVARAVSPPAGPPAPRWFSWENWPGARIAVIEKSPDMENWTQIGRVTNQTHFGVTLEGPQGYFRVGHPANETHHWFDPVLEIYKCDLD